MITDFGQRSFVTWPTSLVERVKMAEKEIQMNKVRGLTKEGERVYGWYAEVEDKHIIIAEKSVFTHPRGFIYDFVEVIPETVGQFVTKDKNGKDVYAGDKVKSGKRIITIVWGKDSLQWKAEEKGVDFLTPLCQWAISEQFELMEQDND